MMGCFLHFRGKRYQLNNEIKKNSIARKITIVNINEKLLVLNVGFLLYRGLRFIDLPLLLVLTCEYEF